MNKYEWDESLETGNPTIDNQHKQLLAALNTLIDKYKSGAGALELEKTLEFLAAYTVKHFNDEEKMQEELKYHDRVAHKNYHNAFKTTVAALSKELKESGYSSALVEKTIKVLADWFIHHIKSDDFKLAAYILAISKEDK